MVIAKVFFITAGTFGAMAFYGYSTKRDLSSIGKILFMALIGLIIATVVNMFLKSPGFDYILSYIGVAIFIGLTAWDSQKIKQMLLMQPDMSEGAQNWPFLVRSLCISTLSTSSSICSVSSAATETKID